MHAEAPTHDVDTLIEAGPLDRARSSGWLWWAFVVVGIASFLLGLLLYPAHRIWGAYYVNLLFWMGLAVGGVITVVICQVVRAKWSATIRRIGEANVAFLPWAFVLLLATYFGKEYLFPWARGPMPGREWWMQPNFVYARFVILMAFLFFVLTRFVRHSLRADIGLIRERRGESGHPYLGWPYQGLVANWRGADIEVPGTQRRLSVMAPIVIALYAVIYSLFAFEMVMAMDTVWFSNMFGGFYFVGNIYMGWGMTILLTLYYVNRNQGFSNVVNTGQLWDLGKLTFGFCMLWGYLFWSQFLPQWYGNMPEETQWLILRTREEPWMTLGWLTFACAFIIPFITLLSDDIKKTPRAITKVVFIVLLGVWLEKYMVVMPQLFPSEIPLLSAELGFGLPELGIFLGFMGAYLLSIQGFLSKYPAIPVANPLTYGSQDW